MKDCFGSILDAGDSTLYTKYYRLVDSIFCKTKVVKMQPANKINEGEHVQMKWIDHNERNKNEEIADGKWWQHR